MIRYFNDTVLGASHVKKGTVCQDHSTSSIENDDVCIITVSDGHGSRTYVRSDRGSDFACKIAEQLTREFVLKNYQELASHRLVQVGARSDEDYKLAVGKRLKDGIRQKDIENVRYWESVAEIPELESLVRDLFKAIYEEWFLAITLDAANNPFSPEELDALGGEKLVKAYGCTLIVAVHTPDFVFAYQIGDGRCFASNRLGEWAQPIPWDADCFLNITTSMCGDAPVSAFRYYLDSTDTRPSMIFVMSDGLEDSYPSTSETTYESEELELILATILKEHYVTDDFDKFKAELDGLLSNLSQYRSQDDMSLSVLYDDSNIDLWFELIDIKQEKFKHCVDMAKLRKKRENIITTRTHQEDRKNLTKSNRQKLEQEFRVNVQKIQEINRKIESLEAEKKNIAAINDEIRQKVGTLDSEIVRLDADLAKSETELKEVHYEIDEKENIFKRIYSELKQRAERLLGIDADQPTVEPETPAVETAPTHEEERPAEVEEHPSLNVETKNNPDNNSYFDDTTQSNESSPLMRAPAPQIDHLKIIEIKIILNGNTISVNELDCLVKRPLEEMLFNLKEGYFDRFAKKIDDLCDNLETSFTDPLTTAPEGKNYIRRGQLDGNKFYTLIDTPELEEKVRSVIAEIKENLVKP